MARGVWREIEFVGGSLDGITRQMSEFPEIWLEYVLPSPHQIEWGLPPPTVVVKYEFYKLTAWRDGDGPIIWRYELMENPPAPPFPLLNWDALRDRV